MENNENGWHISQNGNNIGGPLRNAQVPSSLLPIVLHHLGLLPVQPHSEIAVDDLKTKLKSADWKARAAAVRALGNLDIGVPVELLVSALDDEDASVRAAAVYALGRLGKRAPLDRLVAASHDLDWHVRETAVFALGKQGERIPREALMTALHDADASVRGAVGLALQGNSAEERVSASYGQLWEQKTMQHDKNNSILANGRTSHETVLYHTRNIVSEEIGDAEQVQAYAPREHAPDEYYSQISPGWEKATSFPTRRRLHRGWWAVVAITAVLFFLMGGGLVLWVMPSLVRSSSPTSISPAPKIGTPQEMGFPLEKFIQMPRYSLIVQKDIGTALHLDPKQIATQLRSGESMTDIAAAQGVSASQLTTIEMNAFKDVLDNAVSSGNIDRQLADQWMQQLQNDPSLLDIITSQVFAS